MPQAAVAPPPANLTPRGRRIRLGLGIAMLALAAGLLVFFLASGQPRAVRLAVFIPLWVGGLGLFQSRAGT